MSPSSTPSTEKTPKFHVQPLPTSLKLKKLMRWYYMRAAIAAKLPHRITAWVSAGFPTEFLWAFNIFPLHPENMACVAGARHTSQQLIEHAESLGYCRDLCSYCKTNIGAVDTGIKTSLGGIPIPDLIVTTTTICDTHWKWFQIQAQKYNIPYFVFDIPPLVTGIDQETEKHFIDYIADQFEEFSDFIFQHTRRRLTKIQFQRVFFNSFQTGELWNEIYEYRKLIPAPMSYVDTLADIFPLVILTGIEKANVFLRALLRDIKKRAAKHEGSLPPGKERFRLLFEGIPFWYRIKFMHQLAAFGAVITYEPYTYSFGPRKQLGLTREGVIRMMAKIVMDTPYNYSLNRRIDYFKKIIQEYHIDGVILHENLSCRPSCAGMMDLKTIIQEECGIPVLLLSCDMNDPRAFAEGPMQTRLEGFIEVLENSMSLKEKATTDHVSAGHCHEVITPDGLWQSPVKQ